MASGAQALGKRVIWLRLVSKGGNRISWDGDVAQIVKLQGLMCC